MPATPVLSPSYLGRLFATLGASFTQLVRSPSHSRRAEAARRAARHVLLLAASSGIAIIALMYALDVWEIGLMPKRGSPDLWWVRIVTDFGKSTYVLWMLAALLVAIAVVAVALRGLSRSLLLGLGTRLHPARRSHRAALQRAHPHRGL